jgi:uncharacterized protein (DUF2235 family)
MDVVTSPSLSGPTQLRSPRRIVLCLDGTWNSTYMRKKRSEQHYVVKPSNVLKLARAIVPRDAATGREQIVYYDIGVGALARYPGLANALLRVSDKMLGGGRGAGFEGNVEDALGFLAFNHLPGDEVFFFGFSRGAATAQAVTRFIDWAGGLPTKSDAYYLPGLFRIYVETRGERPSASVLAEINAARAAEQTPRPPLGLFQPISVVLLGVWDTVIAMGSRAAIPGRAAARSFHIGRQPAQCVAHARQALAIDELRYEFRPEIWESARTGQTLDQRWFAGVHSNIGGGYVDDGLANLSFQWLCEGARQRGLVLDDAFLGHYPGYPQDRQYRSDNAFYRTWDAMPWRRGRGPRRLIGRPVTANLTLDRSAVQRMQASPDQPDPAKPSQLRYPDLRRRYRPDNVLRYLAEQPALADFLTALNVDPALPEDVMRTIRKLRAERS